VDVCRSIEFQQKCGTTLLALMVCHFTYKVNPGRLPDI